MKTYCLLILFLTSNQNHTQDNTVKLWDLKTGKIEKPFIGHTSSVYAVSFSPNGKKIITCSADKTAKLWNIETAKTEKTFVGHISPVRAVAFSPNAKSILTGSYDNIAKIWNLETDAIEDIAYPFSLYEMVSEGLELEPEDTPQYKADSIAYAEKIVSDTIEYNQLMANWINSDSYKQHLILLDSLDKEAEYQANLELVHWKPIEDIEKKIKEAKDTIQKYQLCGVLIDTLKERITQSVGDSKSFYDYQAQLARIYESRSWLGLFLKKFKDSEKDIHLGVLADVTNNEFYRTLPPTLLLQGKFNEAKAEYIKWKDKEYEDNEVMLTYRAAFLIDLNTFEKAGIIPKGREADVAAIRVLLK